MRVITKYCFRCLAVVFNWIPIFYSAISNWVSKFPQKSSTGCAVVLQPLVMDILNGTAHCLYMVSIESVKTLLEIVKTPVHPQQSNRLLSQL